MAGLLGCEYFYRLGERFGERRAGRVRTRPAPEEHRGDDGYRVSASDGEAGRVEDFVVDAEGWRIRHVVLGASGRYSAERVLLEPTCIERLAPEARTVHVGLTGKQIWGARRYAGYEVRDPRGAGIGIASEALVNGEAQPGYVRVSTELRAGSLRPRTVLIPAQMIAVDGARPILGLH